MLCWAVVPKDDENSRVKPTTPTFLSEVEAAPETKPVVYSPVPTIRTAGGAIFEEFSLVMRCFESGLNLTEYVGSGYDFDAVGQEP
jgi:hypothetical protein